MPAGVQYRSQQEAQEYADTFDDASGPTAVTMEMSNPDTGKPYWVVIHKDPMDLDSYFNWMRDNDTGMMSEQSDKLLFGQPELGAAITEDGATQEVDILPDEPGLGALLPPPPISRQQQDQMRRRSADNLIFGQPELKRSQSSRYPMQAETRRRMAKELGDNMINVLGGYSQP